VGALIELGSYETNREVLDVADDVARGACWGGAARSLHVHWKAVSVAKMFFASGVFAS